MNEMKWMNEMNKMNIIQEGIEWCVSLQISAIFVLSSKSCWIENAFRSTGASCHEFGCRWSKSLFILFIFFYFILTRICTTGISFIKYDWLNI